MTERELLSILDRITFGPSGIMLDKCDLQWEVHAIDGEQTTSWLVRLTFSRPDNRTGEMGRGFGRWEYIANDASESAIVKTCWLLLELLVRHELMEAFLYGGVRIFDPHKTVGDLAAPSVLHREGQ